MLGLERRFAGDLVAEGGWRVEKEPEACGRELPCEGEPGAPTVPDGSSDLLPGTAHSASPVLDAVSHRSAQLGAPDSG